MEKIDYSEQLINKICELIEIHPERWISCLDKDVNFLGIYVNGLKRVIIYNSYITILQGNELISKVTINDYERIKFAGLLNTATNPINLINKELPDNYNILEIVNNINSWNDMGYFISSDSNIQDMRYERYSDYFEFFIGNKIFEITPHNANSLFHALKYLDECLEHRANEYLKNQECDAALSFLGSE